MSETTRQRNTMRIAVLTLTFLLFALGNLLLPSVFWRPTDNSVVLHLNGFCIGLLCSELGALGWWAGLRNGPFFVRAFRGAAGTIAGAITYLLGLNVAVIVWNSNSPMPYELAIFIWIVSLVGFLFVLSIAIVFKKWKSWTISRPGEPTVLKGSNFSILFLFEVMIVFAFIFGSMRWLSGRWIGFQNFIGMAALIACFYLIFGVRLAGISIWSAMSRHRHGVEFIRLLSAITFVSLVMGGLLYLIRNELWFGTTSDTWFGYFAYQFAFFFGLALGTWFVGKMLLLAGYEFAVSNKESVPSSDCDTEGGGGEAVGIAD